MNFLLFLGTQRRPRALRSAGSQWQRAPLEHDGGCHSQGDVDEHDDGCRDQGNGDEKHHHELLGISGMAIGMAGLCDKCDSLVVMETESRLANSAKLSVT